MWIKAILFGLVGLIICGAVVSDLRVSQVVGQSHRFSMAVSGESGMVSFVSFDPVERRVFVLPFPKDLSFQSRSVGEYTVSSLYKIGQYSGEGASFVRRKVQGFMRVPIPGYLTISGEPQKDLRKSIAKALWQSALYTPRPATNLSRLDAVVLRYRLSRYTWRQAEESEMARAGVLEKREQGGYLYRSDRLQQYVGTRLFDWTIGAKGLTMAIVNFSGIDGMGADMADFVNNLGYDVVSVRTGNEVREHSKVIIDDPKSEKETGKILQNLLGLPLPEKGETASYRAKIVIEIGSDTKELF